MCGICGLINYRGDAGEAVHRMNLHMKDRGPDAEGIRSLDEGRIVFGHRRLSILDLSPAGAQPFTTASGRFTICYNGEIYNHAQIREKMLREHKISAFRSSCDTETLAEAAESYGLLQTLKMCRGMFALALYDRQTRQLMLARDRVGEKPLYYGFIGDAFAFASDVGAFREIEGFDNPVRRDVLPLYFQHGYIPAPFSIYERIWKLEPGTILTLEAPYAPFDVPEILDDGSLTGQDTMSGRGYFWQRYWSMREAACSGQAHPFQGTFREASEELERLLKEAIRGQMVSDVPLGAFLSAGIDSTTIVALMQSISDRKVRTFTIGMDDSRFDEAPAAAQIAAHLGTDHTQMYITDADARAVIPLIPPMFGEPFADSSQIPTYLVSKLTREHVTVSLSGDAGDELFCGYRSYASIDRIWNKMKNIPYGLRSLASALALHTPVSRSEVRREQAILLVAKGPVSLQKVQSRVEADADGIALTPFAGRLKEDVLPENDLPDAVHEAMLCDLVMYHPDDILVKVDRTAMAVSLETRVPYLDRDVVEFAWSLPIDYLRSKADAHGATAGSFTGKLVLRDIAYRYIPKQLLNRPKKGFSVPAARWLSKGPLREWAQTLLSEDVIRRQGYLDPLRVQGIWNDFIQNGRWRPQIWYLLMFQSWLEYCGEH